MLIFAYKNTYDFDHFNFAYKNKNIILKKIYNGLKSFKISK